MPGFVGAMQVISVSSSSIVQVGDTYMATPYSAAKTFAGGGSFNTGDQITVEASHSYMAVNDSDFIDQGESAWI
ncbi:spore germination protein [Halalkalibacillus halophilus]|uniref:spore germination protein n=1 Tax=Halalkalibacillus halophilus TaxID=392827 RepID=UPI00041390DC|nr:spore germination protein [Halalkalibacillus halophilus]